MLLTGTADTADRAPVEAIAPAAPEQLLERFNPHQRIAVLDERVRIIENACRGIVLRKIATEIDRFVEYNRAGIGVDHDARNTLRTGVDAEKLRHWGFVC